MMSAMKHRLLLAAGLVLLLATPARAQFYDLDGAYRCLTAPDPACEKELRDQPRPASSARPSGDGPTLEQVVAKVRDKSLGPREVQFLEQHAAANEQRAVEVLAWCKLNGLGTPADAVAAYWLYRQAAKLGVANARRNQTAVFNTRLTPEERQQVLVQENAQ
jgi:TPR repeat protein